MSSYDVIVIGSGMAGVSIAYELAEDRHVGLLEMESTLAYHTTGRSAANFVESYGGPIIRALTTSSRAFFEDSPNFFEECPLTPIPTLIVAPIGSGSLIRGLYEDVSTLVNTVRLVDPEEAYGLCPVLRPGYLELSMIDNGSSTMDISAIHQGYVRGFRLREGVIHSSSKVVAATRTKGLWTLNTVTGDEYRAPVIVNAAGAWVDEIAKSAGVSPIGILPLRRNLFTIGTPEGVDTSTLPVTGDILEKWYFKPEGPQILCSPADEVLQDPGDARPDELEIARAIDDVNEATTLDIRHVRSSWAGLRNFTPDRIPVVGFDTSSEGFFWFAGQGGYGIQTAPAMARTGAALVRGHDIPDDVQAKGLMASEISPNRPGISVSASH